MGGRAIWVVGASRSSWPRAEAIVGRQEAGAADGRWAMTALSRYTLLGALSCTRGPIEAGHGAESDVEPSVDVQVPDAAPGMTPAVARVLRRILGRLVEAKRRADGAAGSEMEAS
ncbi:hypothetical protein GCM10009534_18200 [Kribbella sandramycini]